MGLIVKEYELPGKHIVPEAYLRIQSIVTENEDCEFLQPIDGTEDLKSTWTTRVKSRANVYVWADQLCRENRVSPIHWFAIEFEYDLNGNIYEQAYSALKTRFIDNINF